MSGIYIASKTKHAKKWRELRDLDGVPVISTWIDEAGEGESSDLADLWRRCIEESSSCDVLIVYREEGDMPLKGGYIEVGSALSAGIPVVSVGFGEENSFTHHILVHRQPNIWDAVALAESFVAAAKVKENV